MFFKRHSQFNGPNLPRMEYGGLLKLCFVIGPAENYLPSDKTAPNERVHVVSGSVFNIDSAVGVFVICLLYTSPSPRDQRGSRMPSSA